MRASIAQVVFPVLFLAAGVARAGEFTQFVDQVFGAGGHGDVFVGANVVTGAGQVGPNQFSWGRDW